MENDLNVFSNERQYQFSCEDDLNFFRMEDNLNIFVIVYSNLEMAEYFLPQNI